MIRPGRVVEMLDLTSFVAASCLECPQHKVRRVFGVRQGDTDVTVLFLLTLGLRPVQLALRLNTSIYNNCQSLGLMVTKLLYCMLSPDRFQQNLVAECTLYCLAVE